MLSTQLKFLYTMPILMKISTPSLLWTDHNDHWTTDLFSKAKLKIEPLSNWLTTMTTGPHSYFEILKNYFAIINFILHTVEAPLFHAHPNERFNTLSPVD